MLTNIKLHWTHKATIKKLYLDGYTDLEISIMYKLPLSEVKRLTSHLEKPERI